MIRTGEITLETRGNAHVVVITDAVQAVVRESELQNGIVTIFCPSATSGVTTMEYESGAVEDFKNLFDQIAPPDQDYVHNQRQGDRNGHSHIRAALLGPSLTVPFVGAQLTLGTWQQIVFVDFDVRPRRRRLVVQMIGET